MPHGFFNHRMRETGDFLGPSAEGRAEAMSRDRTAVHGVDPFSLATEFMRLRSVSSAMFESGFNGAWPGKTYSEVLIDSISRTISIARGGRGTRKPSLRYLRSFRLATGTVHND